METLSRRFSHSFGTWSGFKNTLRHGKSLSNIINHLPAYYNGGSVIKTQQSSYSDISSIQSDKMEPSPPSFTAVRSRTESATSGRGSIVSSRSLSLNSVNSEGCDAPLDAATLPVGHEDILALTHDVRGFKDALSQLRRIFHPERDKQEQIRSAAHERLGNVLRILRGILEKYAALQSTELLMAAGLLIQQIKGLNFEDEKADPTEFFEAIDQVALSFSSRVSEYLMGDLDTSSAVHPAVRTKSCENLPDDGGDVTEVVNQSTKLPDVLTSQQIDETLMRLEQEQGVNVALKRAKVWAKYAKDVVTYIEKRSVLELEHCRGIAKLAQTMRSVLKEENFLPFQSVYCTALDQDADNSNLMQATCSLLQGHKFIEPLTARRNEHEKIRKQLKEMWQRELKKMQDAVNNLRKARTLYIQRQLEYEKAKDGVQRAECLEGLEPSKIDKKKKIEEDTLQKAVEADTTYKACVVEANERHQIMQKVKSEILKQVRELILQCDQTMKAATVSYFQLQHTLAAPLPVQFQTLCESSRLYEPGSQFMEFVKRLPIPANAPVFEPPPFAFEPYQPTDSRLSERRTNCGLEGSEESLAFSSTTSSEHGKGKKTWCPASDSDSVGSNQSNKSVDTSPFGSPQNLIRRLQRAADDLDVDQDMMDSGESHPSSGLSKAANTHAFRKLKTPSRCRECDSYVYFQGIECQECGLVCHKKCAEDLALQCGHKRLQPRLTTFGVDLSLHLKETKATVPLILTRCIDAVERRGAHIKGIYRVSGVKSRVEKLCQSFENGAALVDLGDIHPNVIANVLKLYLRQLPEPLLIFNLYPEFIQIAKNYPGRSYDAKESEEITKELISVLEKLPRTHFNCLSALIHHLRRIGELSDVNNMPPSNLGIVFGPTLLRTSEGTASLSSLIDTVHQTRIVELLIVFAEELFGPDSAKPIDLKEINGKLSDDKDMTSFHEERTESPARDNNNSSPNIVISTNIPLNFGSKDDDNISTHSFDVTDGEGEPPVPPPRRQLSSTKINRLSSDSGSEDVSLSPLPHLCKADRIVIRVESDLPIAAPRTLAPSDFTAEKKNGSDDVPYVDDSPPQTCTSSPVKNNRPIPSPRFCRLSTTNLTTIPVTVTPSTDDEDHESSDLTSSSPSPNILQPSPINSIPSTTSSMDELDILGVSSSASQSPTCGDYVSPYLNNDPYKNLRVAPLVYAETPTFVANCDEPPELTRQPRRHSGDANSTESSTGTELGLRNSILRTATRHQRYSPAYSTASTKSSELSWSSGPEEVGSKPCLFMNHRGSSRPAPPSPLHRVSSDSSVFVKSALDECKGKLSQRPPRFV